MDPGLGIEESVKADIFRSACGSATLSTEYAFSLCPIHLHRVPAGRYPQKNGGAIAIPSRGSSRLSKGTGRRV